jgi:hypothetical protein
MLSDSVFVPIPPRPIHAVVTQLPVPVPVPVPEPDHDTRSEGDSGCFTRVMGVSLPVVVFRVLILATFFCLTTTVALMAVSTSQLGDLHGDHRVLFDQDHRTTLLLNEMWKDVQQLPTTSGIIPVGQYLAGQHEVMQEELIEIHSNVTTLIRQFRMLVTLLDQRLPK